MDHSISRRHFLGGIAATGAAIAVGGLRSPGALAEVAAATGAGTLVLVTLHGGNDAMNTVVPVDAGAYRGARGELALDPAACHDVGAGFALHPSLVQAKALWNQGRLGVVHGVGFPGLDRSHFHCMDVWQAGSEHEHGTGWIGRWLDAVGESPIDAVAIGRTTPLLLRGESRTGAVVPPGPLRLPGGAQQEPLLAKLAGATDPVLAAAVGQSMLDMLSVVDVVGPIVDDLPAGNERLAGQLAVVARLITADLPTRVYAVELAGFDTHANQAGTHAALLTELDTALADFLGGVAGHPVTVLVYSEFGRRVAANASGGTDHGGGGVALVAGNVRPGHHGEPPPLDDLDQGDLRSTVDFRSVYAGLLEGVLGIEAGDVLGHHHPPPLQLV